MTEGAVHLPPVAPPLPTAENTEEVIETSNSYYEMGGFYRRASEKVKVIRRLSSSNGCSSLEDQILLAKEVINDNVAVDGKVFLHMLTFAWLGHVSA